MRPTLLLGASGEAGLTAVAAAMGKHSFKGR